MSKVNFKLQVTKAAGFRKTCRRLQVTSRMKTLFAFSLGLAACSLWLSPLAHAELENFQAADVVLGQSNFTSNTANPGGVSASTLSGPQSVATDGKRLFISQCGNNRILIWNTIPTANFTPADVVVGQPNFTSNAVNNGGVSARSFSCPVGTFSDGKRLIVGDFGNHRFLIWNTVPTTNFTSADVVLGQPNFTSSSANNGGVSTRSSNNAELVFSDGKKLFGIDRGNHRILIWNTIPTTNSTPADVVLGQPDFNQNTASNGGISARSLSTPVGIFSDGKKLFISEFGTHRVLIWHKIPTTNFAPADVVLGQPDFTSGTANNGGVSARSMNQPAGIFSDGKRLFVTDFNNHRTLIWNQIPTKNFVPADIVLGQPNFNSNAINNGGVSARSMNFPTGIISDGKRLFVNEQNNNRTLIFNISGSSLKPDPQFEQGKAVVGKVFHDINENGIQDSPQTTDDRPQKKKKKEKDRGLSTMDLKKVSKESPPQRRRVRPTTSAKKVSRV